MPELNPPSNPGSDPGKEPSQNPDPAAQPKEFVPPATQEEFDKIIGARVSRATKGLPPKEELTEIQRKAAEFDRLEAEKLPAEQRTQQTINGLTTRATTAEALVLRYEAAAEVGLPLKAAKRLHGATREELIADAEEYKALTGASVPPDPNAPRTPAPDPSQGARPGEKLSKRDQGRQEAARRFPKSQK